MTVLDFLKQYGVLALVVIIIMIAVVILIHHKGKGVIYQAALVAVSKAQEAWGSDMGKVKFAEAYAYIKHEFPVITFLVSQKELTKLIDEALEELKSILLAKAEKQKKAGVAFEDMDYITQTIIEQTGNLEKFS